MGKKVFISHATIDNHLIDILIKFLGELGIPKDDIFCTSVSGTLESGKNFIKQIKDNVKGSKIVLFVLSERFFLSNFCLAELGAAWSLNQNILPIIVPPVSIDEYNSTPLLGIQALNIAQDDFAKNFLNDLIRKQVIETANIKEDKPEAIHEFNAAVKNELGILRKDSRGFYVGRLVDKRIRQESKMKQMPCRSLGTICNYSEIHGNTYWKLNGLLDVETDSDITEHWISAGQINLTGTKIQFELGDIIEKGENYKVFSMKTYYEFP